MVVRSVGRQAARFLRVCREGRSRECTTYRSRIHCRSANCLISRPRFLSTVAPTQNSHKAHMTDGSDEPNRCLEHRAVRFSSETKDGFPIGTQGRLCALRKIRRVASQKEAREQAERKEPRPSLANHKIGQRDEMQSATGWECRRAIAGAEKIRNGIRAPARYAT